VKQPKLLHSPLELEVLTEPKEVAEEDLLLMLLEELHG